jgi:hypothetical protein
MLASFLGVLWAPHLKDSGPSTLVHGGPFLAHEPLGTKHMPTTAVSLHCALALTSAVSRAMTFSSPVGELF